MTKREIDLLELLVAVCKSAILGHARKSNDSLFCNECFIRCEKLDEALLKVKNETSNNEIT